MRTVKIFLIVLFFLFGLTSIFTTPGRSAYENFLYSQSHGKASILTTSPGTQILLNEIIKKFPIDSSEILFYRQKAWFVQKFVLYFCYLLTWLSLLVLSKVINKKISRLDVSLIFFVSLPLLQAVSLTYFEILALPLFLISLTFYLKRMFSFWFVIYFLSLLFNWQLIILLPAFISGRNLITKFLIYFGLYTLIFLFPAYNGGQLIWLVVFSILSYLATPSEIEKYKLFLINFFVFILFYRFFGASGQSPVQDTYFLIFRYIISAFFIFYQIWSLKSIYSNKFKLRNVKLLIVALWTIVLLGHLTAVGDPDVDNWAKYTRAVVQYANPFYAHTKVIQLYAPLSTVIMGGFAQVWDSLIGPSRDYAVATKLGILFFLVFSLYLFNKYSSRRIKRIDKFLVFSTTFILINQTLGYGDINIYLIPFILLSMVYLYKFKFFLSGIFLALAISIKWQPLILLPLFASAIFDFRKGLLEAFRNSLAFLAGLVPVIIFFWILVIVQPDGLRVFKTAYELYTSGGVYLSGLALNVNWVVTYLYPALFPEKVGFWMGIGRQATAFNAKLAPSIFSGYFFYLAVFVIVARYWFLKRKTLLTFSAAILMVFYSHYSLNVSAMNLHFFYQAIFMLFLYLLNPTRENRMLLFLFDALAMISNIFFYGFTGAAVLNRLIFGFDITVVFGVYYMVVFFWVLVKYLRGGLLLEGEGVK